MNVSEVRESAARLLLGAYRTGVPVDPLTELYQGLEVADAYEIQQLQVRAWSDQGRCVVGRKVGLTSPAMQRQMRVDRPDFGVLRDDMRLNAEEPVDVRAFIAPRIEPEVAFRLRGPLRGPGISSRDAGAAVDAVFPSLEIIDSRVRDWKISIVDTIADNASSGAFVLGGPGRPLGDVDLVGSECVLYRNGREVASGLGGAVMGDPLNSLAWLANTLAAYEIGLEAGQIVLPGSITASQPVLDGEVWTARFAGVGEVTVQFKGESVGQG